MKKEGFNMKFYEYEYTTFNGETKTLKLRLVSSDMKIIERKTGKSLIDYVSNPTITMITTILMYMNRPTILNFSEKDAEALYDELVDSGLTLEEIYTDIIMETLVTSGFMKKEDLDKMKNKSELVKEEQLGDITSPR